MTDAWIKAIKNSGLSETEIAEIIYLITCGMKWELMAIHEAEESNKDPWINYIEKLQPIPQEDLDMMIGKNEFGNRKV